MGKYREAEYFLKAHLKSLEEKIKLGFGDSLSLASTYAFFGDKPKAWQYLGECNQTLPRSGLIFLKHDPMLESIRNEERFQKILRDQEAKYQAEHERVKKWLEEQGKL
jgi:hypothetical protein